MKITLLYISGALIFFWGVAHLFPTKSVVKGYGQISSDNKYIITMEWIIEGAALIFMGLLIGLVTFIDPSVAVSKAIYSLSMIALVALSVISLLTGFKVDFLPFKLCPFIFLTSAIFILIGGIL